MLNSLRNAYEDQVFFPRWWSVFFNAFYFTRRGLARGIGHFAPRLQGTLLDFGCGSKPYAKLFAVPRYIGVDIAKSGHDHSTSRVDVFYDGSTLPFENDYFDSIFSSEVFEHIFNLDHILSELNRVLKPGGQMLITIPWCWDQHEVPFDYARYTEWGLAHILKRHGFEMIAHEKSSTYIETIAQLMGSYVYKNLFSRNRVLSKLTQLVVVAPIYVGGRLLGRLLPNNGELYLNHIVLVRKSDEGAVAPG